MQRYPALLVIIMMLGGCFLTGGCGSGSNATRYAETDYVYTETDPETIADENLFFVAKNGNDNNPGTESEPWLTIQKAAATLTAGQKVYVKEGVYNERVIVATSGTANNYIIFSAYPGHRVILDGSGIAPTSELHGGGLFMGVDKEYIKVKGFKTRNTTTAGIFFDRSNRIIIKSNYTYNTASSGIGTWNSTNVTIDSNEIILAANPADGGTAQECLTVAGCTNFEIVSNNVHHNGVSSSGGEGINAKHSVSGSIHHNQVHNLTELGIYTDAWDIHATDIDIYNNTVYQTTWGIACAAENGGILDNVRIYNNVIYENYWGIGLQGFPGWGSAATQTLQYIYIYNNTICKNIHPQNNQGIGIAVNLTDGDYIYILNNICYQNYCDTIGFDKGTPEHLVMANNLLGTDTNLRLADPDNYDYHLQRGSAAIDAADESYVPDFDYDGNGRPAGNGYDIGAFERQ